MVGFLRYGHTCHYRAVESGPKHDRVTGHWLLGRGRGQLACHHTCHSDVEGSPPDVVRQEGEVEGEREPVSADE